MLFNWLKKFIKDKVKAPVYMPGDKVAMFDCDDTLVMWGTDSHVKYDEEIYKKENAIEFNYEDTYGHKTVFYLVPNKKTITLMKHLKQTGTKIVVWSAGGAPWAKCVVETLGISHMVSIIMCKPTWYVDDLHCTEWMGMWRQVRVEDGLVIKHGTVYNNPLRKDR